MMIELTKQDLQALLIESAKKGAEQAIKGHINLHKKEACAMLGVSLPTLNKLIKNGAIKEVDGRVPGWSIQNYLQLV